MNKKIFIVGMMMLMIIGGFFIQEVEDQNTNLEYTVLAPLPCINLGTQDCNRVAEKTTLEKYLPGIFTLGIGLAGVFAVLMIVIGGFQYMSSDALQGKNDGKTRIWNSVKGLVLVIAAWLILDTINPSLAGDLNLNVAPAPTTAATSAGGTLTGGGSLPTGTGGTVLPGYVLTQEQVNINNAMRTDLKNNYGIETNAGPCTNGGISGCTNLVGMLPSTFKGITDLKSVCNCSMTITGGTEGGHTTHGPNLPPIDLAFNGNLDKYILDNRVLSIPPRVIPGVGTLYTSMVNGRQVSFLKESDHWHVVF